MLSRLKPKFGPADSFNRKLLQHHSRRSVAGGNSSEFLMSMAVMGGGAGRSEASSLSGCETWNVVSPILEWSPPTPSAICSSPISSLSSDPCGGSEVSNCNVFSFSTDNQSFCVLSNDDGKMIETSTETAEEAARREGFRSPEIHHIIKNPIPVTTRERERFVRQWNRKEAGWRRACERCVSFKTTKFEGEGKLETVGEEEEEGRERRRNLEHHSVPLLSSGGSNSGSKHESSDLDIVVEDLQTGLTPARTKETVDRHMAWKEARISKLMNKLIKEEASINEWEKNKITDAEMEMKKLKLKLEKKREIGTEKMQRKIKSAQKEAEKKKIKQRKASSRWITNMATAFEKIVLKRKVSSSKLMQIKPGKTM